MSCVSFSSSFLRSGPFVSRMHIHVCAEHWVALHETIFLFTLQFAVKRFGRSIRVWELQNANSFFFVCFARIKVSNDHHQCGYGVIGALPLCARSGLTQYIDDANKSFCKFMANAARHIHSVPGDAFQFNLWNVTSGKSWRDSGQLSAKSANQFIPIFSRVG